MTIGIMGSYRCHDIVEPYVPSSLKRKEKDQLDDELRRVPYFRSDSVAYEFFQKKYPDAQVEIFPCEAKSPYKNKFTYEPWHVHYLRVEITQEANRTIFILSKT